jgi:hypothetical protein
MTFARIWFLGFLQLSQTYSMQPHQEAVRRKRDKLGGDRVHKVWCWVELSMRLLVSSYFKDGRVLYDDGRGTRSCGHVGGIFFLSF